LLTTAANRGVNLVLVPLTVAEVVYVLECVYRWSGQEVVDRLPGVIATDAFALADRDAVEQALRWHRDRTGLDFPDAYLAALAVGGAYDAVLSFDRDLQRLPGVLVVDQGRPAGLAHPDRPPLVGRVTGQ